MGPDLPLVCSRRVEAGEGGGEECRADGGEGEGEGLRAGRRGDKAPEHQAAEHLMLGEAQGEDSETIKTGSAFQAAGDGPWGELQKYVPS